MGKKKFDPLIVDAHCDVLSAPTADGLDHKKGQFDLSRMKKGGVAVQFFAVFTASGYKGRELEGALEQIDKYYGALAEVSDLVGVSTYSQLDQCLKTGKRAAVLAVEGGEVLYQSLSILRVLYRLGVRCLTLTWNNRNQLADGVGEKSSRGGLSDFGLQVVKEMNELGMLIDVSHLSERGFWDVLATTKVPVIASHSNTRAVCNHPRNLSDEQIKALAQNGGVVGLTFVPAFVDPDNPCLERLLDHLDHVTNLVGVDHVGFGSDFEGVEKTIAGMDDVSKYEGLKDVLLNRGYREADVEKILGSNLLRVLRQVWK